MWARAKADAIAGAVKGASIVLDRTCEDKRQAPPKLFSLSGLQKRANALWGWAADKTLSIAQELYETHKATTYPRTDCEYLPEEQIPDVPAISAKLLELDAFAVLRDIPLSPRETVFNTSKVSAHHAIIPTKVTPPLASMSSDARQAYLLIAARYLASMCGDYEYKATRISAVAAGVEFATSGNTPTKQGWKILFPHESDEDQEARSELPEIPAGTAGTIQSVEVVGKQTNPPTRYTEGTLIDDMKSVAKFVTDTARKARLKETSGIGAEATRAGILKTIKAREYVVTKGKQLISTEKGRDLIATIEKEMPALADPGETAIWEDGLEAVAEGSQTVEQFVSSIGSRVLDYLGVLAAKPDAAPRDAQAPGAPTGSKIGSVELVDHGTYFAAAGAFTGRVFKTFCGHTFTAAEIVALVGEKQILDVTDCTTKEGQRVGTKKVWYNPEKKPYPGPEFYVQTQSTGVVTEKKRGKGGEIADCGSYYTVEGFESGGKPVRFWKTFAGRDITAEELSRILTAGADGLELNGFKSAQGVYHQRLRYNARKKPYAGLEFVS
jgi:hypothetical protein